MSANSKIAWTDHTFNIVWGCQKIAPECAGCYAETWAHRMGFDVWGRDARRRILSEAYWREPLKWNRQAEKAGERRRVFCGSMCDWLEDHPTVNAQRQKLFPLIEQTPWLDWLMLSKRIENFETMIPDEWTYQNVPKNVWLGMSAGTQKTWDENWPILEALKHFYYRGAFVSVEPMIGAMDISDSLVRIDVGDEEHSRWIQWPDWIIIGGESEQPGWKARRMELDWVRRLIAQARAAEIAVFIKQLGATWAREAGVWDRDPKGEDWDAWPEDLRIREYPREVSRI